MKKVLGILICGVFFCSGLLLEASDFSSFQQDLIGHSIDQGIFEYGPNPEFTAIAELLVRSYYPIYHAKLDKAEADTKLHERSTDFLFSKLEKELVKENSRGLFDYMLGLIHQRFGVKVGKEFKSDIRTVAFMDLFNRVHKIARFATVQKTNGNEGNKAFWAKVTLESEKWTTELKKVEENFLKARVRFH
jgi:hypothetical protein